MVKVFIDVWQRVTRQLDEYIEQVAERGAPIKQWQLRDVGHCFENFRDEGLLQAFRLDIYARQLAEGADYLPQKNGLKAVLFEDDHVQRARWRQAVNAHTPYTVPEELALPTEEGLEAIIDDPEIGLFIIDIQNGNDVTAGIRWGEQVLRRRFASAERSADVVPTNIVVWSASIEAVQAAEAHFAPIVKQLEDTGAAGISYSVGKDNRSMNSNPIDFTVKRKTWTGGILRR